MLLDKVEKSPNIGEGPQYCIGCEEFKFSWKYSNSLAITSLYYLQKSNEFDVAIISGLVFR